MRVCAYTKNTHNYRYAVKKLPETNAIATTTTTETEIELPLNCRKLCFLFTLRIGSKYTQQHCQHFQRYECEKLLQHTFARTHTVSSSAVCVLMSAAWSVRRMTYRYIWKMSDRELVSVYKCVCTNNDTLCSSEYSV